MVDIESNIIFCDRCHPSKLINQLNQQQQQHQQQYYFTKCGKIYCKDCIQSRNDCNKCGGKNNCTTKLIDKNLTIENGLFFRNYSQLIKKMDNVYLFQMQRHRQNIQYLMKAINKLKTSIAEKTAIQLSIAEKNREIEKLENEIELLKRNNNNNNNDNIRNPTTTVNPNDSFFDTFIQNVEQQQQQQIDIENNLLNPNNSDLRSRYSDKSSTIGLAYPIRRDQSKHQQQPLRMESINQQQNHHHRHHHQTQQQQQQHTLINTTTFFQHQQHQQQQQISSLRSHRSRYQFRPF